MNVIIIMRSDSYLYTTLLTIKRASRWLTGAEDTPLLTHVVTVADYGACLTNNE